MSSAPGDHQAPADPPERIVDALGSWCPVPLRLLDRAARRLPAGARIDLLADDPLIVVDLPAWCHRRGHRLLWLRPADEMAVVDPDGRREYAARVQLLS